MIKKMKNSMGVVELEMTLMFNARMEQSKVNEWTHVVLQDGFLSIFCVILSREGLSLGFSAERNVLHRTAQNCANCAQVCTGLQLQL